MPFALQTGEISPKWLAGQSCAMDDTVDEDEASAFPRCPGDGAHDAAVDGDPRNAPAAQGGPTRRRPQRTDKGRPDGRRCGGEPGSQRRPNFWLGWYTAHNTITTR